MSPPRHSPRHHPCCRRYTRRRANGSNRRREAFGLTATEAEVAPALVGGASAGSIARERAVSPETVRSHLKTIDAETGTKRQASLVASIMHLRDVARIG